MLTLYHGNSYQEGSGRRGGRNVPQAFSRTQFETNKMVFNLDAFELDRTDEKLWSNSKSIKNIREIRVDLDSMEREINHFHFLIMPILKPLTTILVDPVSLPHRRISWIKIGK